MAIHHVVVADGLDRGASMAVESDRPFTAPVAPELVTGVVGYAWDVPADGWAQPEVPIAP